MIYPHRHGRGESGSGQRLILASFPSPLATTLTPPTVTLGGVNLPVVYSGLAPGQVGVNQINVNVPSSVPPGLSVPLVISQGGSSNSSTLRVVD